MLELTILMPCLNEARTLRTCVDKALGFMREHGIAGEVLVADNGSSDGSRAIASAAGARVVAVSDRGYGCALRAGIAAARGRYVIMGDADDSYDFSQLQAFVERLRAGDQLVMGNRFRGGIEPGAMPWHHRYVGNPVLSFVGRLLFKSAIRDFHCGLRGFHRDAVLTLGLQSNGMEFASEMVVKATLHGLRITEVPTRLARDGRDRPPHLRSFRDGWRHLRFLLIYSPRWLLLYPGLACLALGLALQAALFRGPLVVGQMGLDVQSMLYAAGLGILGLQMSIFWVLSQYLAWKDGLLPKLPPAVCWLARQPLEAGLVVGAVLFLAGFALALIETVSWAGAGFSALDPMHSMRVAIPALTLLLGGAEVAFASFVFSLARIPASHVAFDYEPLTSEVAVREQGGGLTSIRE